MLHGRTRQSVPVFRVGFARSSAYGPNFRDFDAIRDKRPPTVGSFLPQSGSFGGRGIWYPREVPGMIENQK